MRPIRQSEKLRSVRYDVRGPLLDEANKLEAAGHHVLKLNVGNTAAFGFAAPEGVQADVIKHLSDSQGYSDSRGIDSARSAVAHYYRQHGISTCRREDVFIGNGVSELISMAVTALVGSGDEVLVPSPDYPLWTGVVTLAGGIPVHYTCDESNGWQPDLADIASKITERTRALVVINPNNPTGAVYSRATLDGLTRLARDNDLVVMADEIYEKIVYDDVIHHHAAGSADDSVLCLTFSGLSKAYQVCGYRSGWLVVSGARDRSHDFLEGLTLLANMRMCANVPGQHAIAAALGADEPIKELVRPGGRFYEQSKLATSLLNDIPGVSCFEPQGALYCFPKLDLDMFAVQDDEALVLDLLRQQRILLTHGTGFNWHRPDHLRLTFLPEASVLEDAINRIGHYLDSIRI